MARMTFEFSWWKCKDHCNKMSTSLEKLYIENSTGCAVFQPGFLYSAQFWVLVKVYTPNEASTNLLNFIHPVFMTTTGWEVRTIIQLQLPTFEYAVSQPTAFCLTPYILISFYSTSCSSQTFFPCCASCFSCQRSVALVTMRSCNQPPDTKTLRITRPLCFWLHRLKEQVQVFC